MPKEAKEQSEFSQKNQSEKVDNRFPYQPPILSSIRASDGDLKIFLNLRFTLLCISTGTGNL